MEMVKSFSMMKKKKKQNKTNKSTGHGTHVAGIIAADDKMFVCLYHQHIKKKQYLTLNFL